jgi:hypothetical protein
MPWPPDQEAPLDNYPHAVVTKQQDIWLEFQGPNHDSYRARIATGGAIGNLQNGQGIELLSPSFRNEKTDRIIQWTWWSGSLATALPELQPFERRFNVTQGGDFSGRLSPTVTVDLAPNGIDVYSRSIDNWLPVQQRHLRGGFSALTRYRIVGPGLLLVRRVLLVGRVELDGVEGSLNKSYLEGWTPVNRSVYNAYALGISSGGQPNWWYSAGNNIPTYPNTPVTETNGYAMAYRADQTSDHEVFGIVFGKKHPETCSSSGVTQTEHDVALLNSMTWDTGFGILPAVSLNDIEKGDLVDISYAIALGKGITPALLASINLFRDRIPAPRVWKASAAFDPELRRIRARLQAYASLPGSRVDRLVPLIAAVAPNAAESVEESVCRFCHHSVDDLDRHHVPCYCRMLLNWDLSGRKGPFPKWE